MRLALPIVRAGVFVFALSMVGCPDQPKKLDANSLKAEVQNAEQLSREGAMVLELRAAGKLTERFRKVHELYLLKQFDELKKTADAAKPNAEIQSAFEDYKRKLQALDGALRKIDSDPHKEAFEAVTNDLEALEKTL
jgi:hypothetical protein